MASSIRLSNHLLVIGQLERAVSSWPELSVVLAAADDTCIETVEPTEAEQQLLSSILNERPGLGVVDCGLLAVAKMREWSLVTCDDRLAKAAVSLCVDLVELDDILSRAFVNGALSADDCNWIDYYRNGGTQSRGISTA